MQDIKVVYQVTGLFIFIFKPEVKGESEQHNHVPLTINNI